MTFSIARLTFPNPHLCQYCLSTCPPSPQPLETIVRMPEKPQDYVAGRGRKESTPLGTTIFCGLRALDPLLQRSLLLSAPLASLAPYLGRSVATPPPTGGSVITTGGLDLTPFQVVVWGMSVGSAVKQIFWVSRSDLGSIS